MRIFNSSTIFIFLGLLLGFGSALQSLETMGVQPVADESGWNEWRLSVDDRLQPYAMGHFLAAGSLPAPVSTHFYIRDLDDDGNPLRGDCNFVVDGPGLSARWWSLSVRNFESTKPQAVLSAGRAVLDSNKQLHATIALHPTPGNWLQPDGKGTFTLTYVISELEKSELLVLPHVKRGRC